MLSIFSPVICLLFATILSNINFINPNIREVTKLYSNISLENIVYQDFKEKLEVYLKDAELEEKEFEEIQKKYDRLYNHILA